MSSLRRIDLLQGWESNVLMSVAFTYSLGMSGYLVYRIIKQRMNYERHQAGY